MDAETSVARHSTLRPVVASQTENTKSEACRAPKQLIKMNVSFFFLSQSFARVGHKIISNNSSHEPFKFKKTLRTG